MLIFRRTIAIFNCFTDILRASRTVVGIETDVIAAPADPLAAVAAGGSLGLAATSATPLAAVAAGGSLTLRAGASPGEEGAGLVHDGGDPESAG